MYETKVFTREMKRIHGKIFVWSFKGEIYIRKDSQYAPKRKINCENDLTDIRKGTVSLDPDEQFTRNVRNTRFSQNYVRNVNMRPGLSSYTNFTAHPAPHFASVEAFPVLCP